jgi:adenosylhomocysteinase
MPAGADSQIADPGLAGEGRARIDWADAQMPVLGSIRERFAAERPLDGVAVGACLHVTSETANLVRTLRAGGAAIALCAPNPLSTQDDVAAALVAEGDAEVHAVNGEDMDAWAAHVAAVVASGPRVTLDDGADLVTAIHAGRQDLLPGLLGATEETTTGLVRLRALESEGVLACPVIAVNEAFTERAFNDRHGTGQSALDGIVRATNLLIAGRTVVVLGYGWTGQGVALRAKGLGASVVVCEVDPLRALEARMDGFEVMPALKAAERGDIFVTVTGARDVLCRPHFERMKDGAVLANAGHFDVEIDVRGLAAAADSHREARPLVDQYVVGGRRLNLLAQGRLVNLSAAEGHPAAVMDVSFALQALSAEHLVRSGGRLERRVHQVPARLEREVARLKLDSLGVEIDELTPDQAQYLTSWDRLGR